MFPCCTTIESRAHIVGECEIYKEERYVLGMRKFTNVTRKRLVD